MICFVYFVCLYRALTIRCAEGIGLDSVHELLTHVLRLTKLGTMGFGICQVDGVKGAFCRSREDTTIAGTHNSCNTLNISALRHVSKVAAAATPMNIDSDVESAVSRSAQRSHFVLLSTAAYPFAVSQTLSYWDMI